MSLEFSWLHVSCGLPERTYEDVRTGSILADYLTSYFFRGADYAHKIKLVSTNTFDIPAALLMVQYMVTCVISEMSRSYL